MFEDDYGVDGIIDFRIIYSATYKEGDAPDIFVVTAKQGHDSIADFEQGVDRIGLPQGITFSQLSFIDKQILYEGHTLAILTGIETATLNANDFIQL
ncbi:hypothetical protein IQ238_10505 [Pleurocapsales cyanobacterium LEGE 06147]|nr:hypothetical protein [Pleurocapsales cyanobacterium LEGE 06147]